MGTLLNAYSAYAPWSSAQPLPIRTSEQYVESLRDGRQVYMHGGGVADVTTHEVLARTVKHSATIYDLQHQSDLKDLFTYKSQLTNGLESRYFNHPQNADDLLKRNLLIEETTKRCRGSLNIVKAIGTDALFALHIVTWLMDRELGTKYSERVKDFRAHCEKNDLAMAVAQTDVKGDRGLRPHEQHDPDLYLRVVEKRSDGIVLRGAKAHTTAAPVVNEIFAIPTRAMTDKDGDYAVAVAVPANAKGLKMICRPMQFGGSEFDYPVSSRNFEIESLTIFDDVFVPWDRVFMCGETRYAGGLAALFANFHRFTAISYKPPTGDLFIGAAQLIAEYNGLADAGHVREKLSRLIQYTEVTRACAKAAALDHERHASGLAIPNAVMTNIGKYHFASQFHEAVKLVQDIAGGLVITGPSQRDLENPETGRYIHKYLAGKRDVPTESRLRVLNLIRDLTATEFGGYNLVVSIHGEGSLEAQTITTYREYDIERCKGMVKEILSLP